LLQHATGGQAQENVGTFDDLTQCTGIGFLHELDLVFVHQLRAALVHHTSQVGHVNVVAGHAQLDQQVQTGQCRSARARGDQLHLFDVFVHHFQAVQQSRTHHDGRAMLVVMENRNFHALAQLAFDIEAVRRLDVFQVDAAERGFE
jgi:hypothetical protein